MEWELLPTVSLPSDFIILVREYTKSTDNNYLATLLGQRNIRSEQQLKDFFCGSDYQASNYTALGEEILTAKERLEIALLNGENIAICGNGEPDNLIANIILWHGLSRYFEPNKNLFYHLTDYLNEFHSLSQFSLNNLAQKNIKLIIIADSDGNNFKEAEFAHQLGIDIILLSDYCLPVNPVDFQIVISSCNLPNTHPLFKFPLVGIAYKLMECLADNWSKYEKFELESLLDIVAIGLIYDLIELNKDSRYLAKIALKKLAETPRLGLQKVIKLCEKKGDRPTDINDGIASYFNRLSRLERENNFYLELFTVNESKKAQDLVEQLEFMNIRSKDLTNRIITEVEKKLTNLDLSTHNIIVLADSKWELSMLPLVAKIIAEKYGFPTILLNITDKIARGYGYGINEIEINELGRSPSNLLLNYTNHPLTPKLTLLTENINIFYEQINQKLRQKNITIQSKIQIDMIVTVADLSGNLFKETQYLKPYSLNNKPPRFLVKNCWIENITRVNKTNKIKFSLKDESTSKGFSGIYLSNNHKQLPENTRLDIVIEKYIDFYKKEVQIKIISYQETNTPQKYQTNKDNLLIDLRNSKHQKMLPDVISINKIPIHWQELKQQVQIAEKSAKKIALTYSTEDTLSPLETWKKLLGIAKYLASKNQEIERDKLANILGLNITTLQQGLISLAQLGLVSELKENKLQFSKIELEIKDFQQSLLDFIKLIEEEQFKKEYFAQVDLDTLSKTLKDSI